ncbi:MAG: hypothetical protein QXM96_03190 [Candidatus Woesearchaeota archaeon]
MKDLFIWFYVLLHGIQDDPLWDDAYFYSGLVLIFVTLIFVFLYYCILNKYFISYFKNLYWYIFLFINSLLIAFLNSFIAYYTIEPIEFSSEYLSFALINFIYAAIFFTLFSYFIRFLSPLAKYTPSFFSKSKRA